MAGPVESPYPGTPIALAFLGLFAAVYFRSVLYARSRKSGVAGRHDQKADVVVTVMVALSFLVVLWEMWRHR
jgi:hypothetical protein